MPKEIAAVWSESSIKHNPPPGNFDGISRDSFDLPSRSDSIIHSLKQGSVSLSMRSFEPEPFDVSYVYEVHDPDYVAHLRSTSEHLTSLPNILLARSINPQTHAADVAEYPAFTFPSVFPHGPSPRASHVEAVKGFYHFDTATPVSGNTYEMAMLSAHTALTGAHLLSEGFPLVYVLTRPPGHHAEHNKAGSYCYLNNAAIAARFIERELGGKVAIVDIDAHHGNGTQEIFYDSANVFYGSIHGSPAKIPPYYSGLSDEVGEGKGIGYNLNIPLEIGSGDDAFLVSLTKIISNIEAFCPSHLLVSLGFDGYEKDPLNIFKITKKGFAEAAKLIGELHLPTLCIQEGGYYVEDLGDNVLNFMTSLGFHHN